jgi:hypothetical protein
MTLFELVVYLGVALFGSIAVIFTILRYSDGYINNNISDARKVEMFYLRKIEAEIDEVNKHSPSNLHSDDALLPIVDFTDLLKCLTELSRLIKIHEFWASFITKCKKMMRVVAALIFPCALTLAFALAKDTFVSLVLENTGFDISGFIDGIIILLIIVLIGSICILITWVLLKLNTMNDETLKASKISPKAKGNDESSKTETHGRSRADS